MVIDELIVRNGTTNLPIDSYNNQMMDEIVYEGQNFHFAKQKDLAGTSEIVADNGVAEPIISLGVSGDTLQNGTPTPEAPIPIQNANNNGMSVVLRGDNLFNVKNATKLLDYSVGARILETYSGSNLIYFEINGGETITVSLAKCSRFVVCTSETLPQIGTLISNRVDGGAITPSTTPMVFTITTNKNSKYLIIRYYNFATDKYSEKEILDTLKVAEVVKTTITIPTSIDVNGTNVSLLFSEYDKLTVDRLNNKVIYSQGSCMYSYTGEETGASKLSITSGNGNNYRSYYGSLFNKLYNSISCYSNRGYLSHFKKGEWKPLSAYGTCAIRTTDIIFRTDRVQTLDEFKAFLKEQYENGTPVTFICQRQTPIEHDITSTDLGQSLLALATCKGTNYLEISSDLAPSQTDLSYWRQIIPNE